MTGQQLFENGNTVSPRTWASLSWDSRALCEIVAAAVTAGVGDLADVGVTIPDTAETVSIRGMTVPAALAQVAAMVATNAARVSS